jgi:hypothetical protein
LVNHSLFLNKIVPVRETFFGLWNWVSSVVHQREKKARICAFFFRARRFLFVRARLSSHSRAVFASRSRARKREKAWAPTSQKEPNQNIGVIKLIVTQEALSEYSCRAEQYCML